MGNRQMKLKLTLLAATASVLIYQPSPARAQVTAAQVAQLGTTLTPLGAEMAGNADGSIPAWTGGVCTMNLASGPDGNIPQVFTNEQKLFTIDASNVSQYADKLTPGEIKMIGTFQGFHMDVYPTHRTGCAPQWVYDNVKKNALTAYMKDDYPFGFYGGIPFPIPQNGEEIAWNSNTAWAGTDTSDEVSNYIVPFNHSPILTSTTYVTYYKDLYQPSGSAATYDGIYTRDESQVSAPANRVGEVYDSVEPTSTPPQDYRVWEYLVGQRRLRLAPNIGYDGAYPDCGGLMDADEIYVFNSKTDHYDWKLLGKKEIYVPYNENGASLLSDTSQLLGPQYLNPDHIRWELHRVWVVDATVRSGFRNLIAHRTLYADEDTWSFILADEYDSSGNLVKFNSILPMVDPAIPAVPFITTALYDLHGGGYCMFQLPVGPQQYILKTSDKPVSAFNPQQIVNDAAD